MPETLSARNGAQACENVRNSLGLNYKSSLTISAKPVGVGVACSPLIVAGERPFPFGAILLFPFLFLQSLLGLPPRDAEMVIFAG
jgi:hypothetical protein